jgi:hypothetical protein
MLLRLRDRMAPVGLDRLQVRSVNDTAWVDIVAKVAGTDGLVFVGLNLLEVRSANDAIGIDIAR